MDDDLYDSEGFEEGGGMILLFDSEVEGEEEGQKLGKKLKCEGEALWYSLEDKDLKKVSRGGVESKCDPNRSEGGHLFTDLKEGSGHEELSLLFITKLYEESILRYGR